MKGKSIDYKSLLRISLFLLTIALIGCKSTGDVKGKDNLTKEQRIMEDPYFSDKKDQELFRVYISSDLYLYKQYSHFDTIQRDPDKGGDQFIQESLKEYDRISEIRDGVVRVLLYGSSGAVSRVHPQRLTFLKELDQVMVEDIQRWRFKFPKNIITPTQFLVRYRFELKSKIDKEKSMTDLEKKYLEENPQFKKYLEQKKREQALKDKLKDKKNKAN